MNLCSNKATGLSPIQELSDMDLSFLISQLSSVSGEITDRTLEELLRDAECQPPSLNWCRQKELATHVLQDLRSKSPPNGNTNLFKTAIDTLSEISTRVQEKLSLDEEEPGIKIDTTTYRQALSARSEGKPPSLKSAKEVQPKVDTRWTSAINDDNSSLRKSPRTTPKKFTRQSTMSAAVRLYGKKLTPTKPLKTVQPIFIPTCKPAKVSVTAGCNKHEGKIMNRSTRTVEEDQKSVRDLWDENARLNSQIENIKAQLSAHNRVIPPSPHSPDNEFQKSEPVKTDDIVAQQLRQFEAQLSAIRETHQVQLERLTHKCEELEKLHHKSVPLDAKIETDLAQNGNCVEVVSSKSEVPNLNLDDLVLEPNFVAWNNQEEAKNKLSGKCEKTVTKKSICRNCAGSGSGEQRRLHNTIRKLQAELDICKKANQRLQVQQKNLKPRNFGRSVIKRNIGTQTIGLGACNAAKYDPSLFDQKPNVDAENKALKLKISELENEVKTLSEQKAMGLKLLQIKHEEEIEVLLEEKMQLSKKIEAIQSWNPW